MCRNKDSPASQEDDHDEADCPSAAHRGLHATASGHCLKENVAHQEPVLE